MRMQHGAVLLQTTDLRVAEVAQRVGYRQAAQFAKAFRRHHGVSPTGLRRARPGLRDSRRHGDRLRHRTSQPGHRLDRRRRSATPSSRAGSTRATSTSRSASATLNAQTRWVLERSGAPEPELLPPRPAARARRHAGRLPDRRATATRSARSASRWPRQDLELMPIVDDDGALAGVITERTLARRYIRESREVTSLPTPPTSVRRDRRPARRRARARRRRPRASPAASGCWRWTSARCPTSIGDGDVVVVGNRDDAQRRAIELGVALLVTSNGTRPADDVLALAARARHVGGLLAARTAT